MLNFFKRILGKSTKNNSKKDRQSPQESSAKESQSAGEGIAKKKKRVGRESPGRRPRREEWSPGTEGRETTSRRPRNTEGAREGDRGRGDRSSGRRGRGRAREPREIEPLPQVDPRPETPRMIMEEGTDLPKDFADLGLSIPVLYGVKATGYESPTQIQAKAIPLVLEGRDVVGASQTGTGKTAAFALPVLSRLGEHDPAGPRVLVLEPVRELAAQVYDAFMTFAGATNLRTALLHGGVKYGNQIESLLLGSDVVVATPGRLIDHLERGTFRLDKIQFLILDEVDRMLDMGFLPDVRRIVKQCPEKRQTLFFSATMPTQIESLASWVLKDPVEIEIGLRISAADTVSHAFYPVSIAQRDELLYALLKDTDFKSVMIFTRTKRDADRLFEKLTRDGQHTLTILHSDIKQSDRAKALAGFREGKFEVIIATDLAARGLDVSGVTHVINYQVPENAEDYVHRIGRTGRAKQEGDAFTLLSADELDRALAIEALIGQKIERRKVPNFSYTYTALLDEDSPNLLEEAKKLRSRNRGGGRPGGRRKRR